MLIKNKATLQNFADATQHEFLETNGLGGWSGSSIIGAHTRRYHGLLVAATLPPTERTVLVSKLDETIVTGQTRYQLGVNLYPGPTIQPNGHHYLNSFAKDLFPEWEYEADGIKLKKTIAMVHGENTVLVIYDVLEAPQTFSLELLPLMAGRGYHSLAHEGPQMHWHVDFEEGIFHNLPDGKTDTYILVPGATYQHTPRWFNNFQYPVEQYRGLDYTEDLFNHGTFTVELKQGDSLGVIISTENPGGRNAHELFTRENMRRQLLVSHQPDDEVFQDLVLAADQFIVKRSVRTLGSQVSPLGGDVEGALKTIIAGYHWFTDWGRDTMISLPGLCLSTGRFEDAKKILSAFAKSVSQGMLPNRFQDNGEEPEYNNVDGTLWYFVAVNKYLEATGDRQFILSEILPVLKDIIDWHYHGTRYNIRVANDGLLFAGEPGQQLTWMDARIGNWVVTPRMGKPVEIQALWYNALKIFADLLELNGQTDDGGMMNMAAERVRKSFGQQFWYVEGNYLYDNINENGERVAEFRPNQLFAISLPFPLIEGDKAMVVLQQVTEHLYTPVGLKTLPKSDKHYTPVYGGDQYHRDSSYHEGTVWSWLLGPYVDSIMKVYGNQGKSMAQKVIDNFSYHLNEACIGSVSEIFDADPPHHPRGCVAQAWSVGEILRVIKDYQLIAPKLQKIEVKYEAAEV
jgi:predicted glycogen debranching enzyme